MNLCCCQFDIAWEEKTANFQRVRALLERDRPQEGSLVLLPEMFATGFSMNVAGIAEDRNGGPTSQFLGQLARDFRIYALGGYVTVGRDGKGRNALACYAPDGSRVCEYEKIHPFSFGEEHRHYVGGDRVCNFTWNGATVAPFICYDLRFPEIFRHATTRNGAEVLTVIANWPAAREEHWLTLLRARAIENQCYVAAVNRIGADPKVSYSGRSVIYDPKGVLLADADNAERTISAEIDLESLRTYRKQFPVLNDIRPRFLGE